MAADFTDYADLIRGIRVIRGHFQSFRVTASVVFAITASLQNFS
jgi:hypothetical protein